MSKILRFAVWTLLIGGALVGLLRLTAIRWWQVPLGDPYLEASLGPTLHGGDWIILWRATAPVEGNLVLCPEPNAPQRLVIGRIVAESNDHVQLAGEAAIVNQRAFETESSCDKFSTKDPASGLDVPQGCRLEVVGSATHLRGELNPKSPRPADAVTDVPPGNVYLVSDNRQFPWDSREFGVVPRSTCAETIVFRLVSKEGFFDVANRLTLIR
ncbi:MAG: signal peptidase I [Polyangiaceae bacterium]